MSSKHTPGPWAYQEDSDAYTHIVRGPGNGFICQLAQTTSAEIEANARLIAAAPEMFEALDTIGGLSRALRQGGPDPMDLQGLSDALEEAIDLANSLVAQIEGRA